MVILLAPLVIAGYVQYKKQKAEREAQEGQQAEKSDDGTEEGLVKSDSAGSIDSGASCSSPTPTTEPPGPMAKFIRFCENLEKEIQKAQERKRQEAAAEALKKAQAAESMKHMDSTVTTTEVSDDSTESGDAMEPSSNTTTTRQDGTMTKSRSLPNLHSLTLQEIVHDQERSIVKRCNSMPVALSRLDSE